MLTDLTIARATRMEANHQRNERLNKMPRITADSAPVQEATRVSRSIVNEAYDSDSRYYPVGTLMIPAIKRHTASGLVGFQSLQIIFVFAEDYKLARFDVRPVYTTL
jgi:hypothetical protein